MQRRVRMFSRAVCPLFALALLLGGLASPGPAKAETRHTFQSWSAAFVQARVGYQENAPGIWLDVHARRGNDTTAVLFRPGLGYYFGSVVSVWAGYLAHPTFVDGGEARYEHRPWEQVQLVLGSRSTTWTLRTRLEQRWLLEDPELGWRARQLVRWQENLGDEAAWVVWDEAFVALNETEWGQPSGFDQNRLFVGPAWLPRQGVRLEGGYLSVVLPRSESTTWIHALSLNAFLFW